MRRSIIYASVLLLAIGCRRDTIYDVESNYTASFHAVNHDTSFLGQGKRAWWNDPTGRSRGWGVLESVDLTQGTCVFSTPGGIGNASVNDLFPSALEQFRLYVYHPGGGRVLSNIYNINQTYMQPQLGRYYLLGISPGEYDMVACSDFPGATFISYQERFDLITAETDVLSTSPNLIVSAPGPIYVASRRAHRVPYVQAGSGYHDIAFTLLSPVQSWRVIIHGIANLEFATDINMLLTNQYRDVLLADMKPEGNAIIAFGGVISEDMKDIDTRFGTFGMIPGHSYILQCTIKDNAGYTHKQSFDITRQVSDENNSEHIIEFDWNLSLDTLIPGGLQPGASEWDEEREEQVIS